MEKLFIQLLPELTLVAVACLLFLLGVSPKTSSRRLSAWVALITLVTLFFVQLSVMAESHYSGMGFPDVATNTVNNGALVQYVRLIVTGVGSVLVLLAWPTNADATGSDSLNFGREAGEFYALMLLSLAGVLLVASANDIILLFLGIELASIPTYIMVSISRPLPVAQEAGVKYFFLGAMAAAIMLFGFSYLYGTTGFTRLNEIQAVLHPAAAGGVTVLSSWQKLAVIMLLVGFTFKIAAVPLHEYVGDVYQGAATPVTAFLAFVPKTSGFLAIIKVLSAVGGTHWSFEPLIINTLCVIAALTMTIGNALGLLQFNVKRVLAYSSVAHSGYMLVGIAALAQAYAAFSNDPTRAAEVQAAAIGGVLFYLAAYGIMNSGAFGVLMMLPSRDAGDIARPGKPPRPPVATTAETYDNLAGQGKRHVALGLAMAVCCFSLIGIPATVGFFGKFYLIQPALAAGLVWLVVITMVNAAISAGYYLKIVATMFLRPAPDAALGSAGTTVYARHHAAPHGLAAIAHAPFSLSLAVVLSVAATIMFGTVVPAVRGLTEDVQKAAGLETPAELTAAPSTGRHAEPQPQSETPPSAALTAAPDHAGPPEWDLFNKDRDKNPKDPTRAYWSLQIMAFKANALRKEAAVQAVASFRKSGVEAYYYHGDTISSVCVGSWPLDAVKRQGYDGSHTVGDPSQTLVVYSPGVPLPPVDKIPKIDNEGRPVVIVPPAVDVLDDRVTTMMKKYPFHAVNYEIGQKKGADGRLHQEPSFLVVIPRDAGNGSDN